MNYFAKRVNIKRGFGVIKKHNTGVYFTDIPVHPFTNCANINYKEAEDRGYFKLDFLNVHLFLK